MMCIRFCWLSRVRERPDGDTKNLISRLRRRLRPRIEGPAKTFRQSEPYLYEAVEVKCSRGRCAVSLRVMLRTEFGERDTKRTSLQEGAASVSPT